MDRNNIKKTGNHEKTEDNSRLLLTKEIDGQKRSEVKFVINILILYKITKGQLRSDDIFGGVFNALKVLPF